MLKKLRLKFIIINMTIVMLMLSLIFGLLFFSIETSLEVESIRTMREIAMSPKQLVAPDDRGDNVHLPYFSIMVNEDGEMFELGGGFFDLSDEELIDSILSDTVATGKDSGTLKEYDLRFVAVDTRFGRCYVYSDTTSEQAILSKLIRGFVAVGIIAFLFFLGISWLLARWAVKPVENAWLQQKQFVADAAHELKTPITVIMTDAELLHSPECTEAEHEQLSGSIITISAQMRGLVESLLELARIDSGSLKETKHVFRLSELVQSSAMIFEPLFFEKDMSFSYEVEPDIVVNGNDTHLKQLTEIFLDNAVKYAAPGGETKLTLRRTGVKKCVLSVTDQGEPIADEDLKNLFKRFYRVDKARTSRQSYGLGLSIAESIAHEHKGKVWAESRDGWNTFSLEISCQ